MRNIGKLALASVSLWAISTPAFAQDNGPRDNASFSDGEIVVSARRREESAQDVPLVVNAVTSEALDKLNIREFKDVQSLVPGLQLGVSQNGIGAQATLRGVAYDVNASGNNGTIEFYLNEAHLSAGILFQSMYDIGQIEVLRGPQGTLRGRASPSGSITVTTRRPDLREAGGYMNGTANDIHGWNLNGAINVPIIEDKLAVRFAGVIDQNRDNLVRSINNPLRPHQETQGGRVSVRAEPFDFLSLNASYTVSHRDSRSFDRVESLSVRDPSAPVSPVLIRASDALAVMQIPRTYAQDFKVYNWQAQLRLYGQKLDYVGSHNTQHYVAGAPSDIGSFFGSAFPLTLRSASQSTDSRASEDTHEFRLSNEERIGGVIDYVAGYFYDKLDSPTALIQQTPLFLGILTPQASFVPTPAGLAQIINTPINRGGGSVEKSFFGNVTAHIGDSFELAGGARHIKYHSTGFLTIGGAPVAAANEDRRLSTTIYSASAKYQITPDVMAYASFGTSWRPGSSTNTILLREITNPDALLSSYYFPDPEKSKSYEIGFKSEWFDKRLRVNVTAYHQTFKNYAFSTPNLFVAGRDVSGVNRVFTVAPALAVGVPAKVDGVEAEIALQAMSRWDIGVTLSYAKSKIKNGTIPCNDYFPKDGNPDSSSQVPTFDQIIAANGGKQIALCDVNFRAGISAPFSAVVRTEYSLPVGDFGDAYLRGLFNYYGKSLNQPGNAFDDIKSYGLLNLYAGVRDPDSSWDLNFFVKNVFDVGRALAATSNAQSVSYQQLFCTPQNPQIAPFCPNGAITFGQNGTSTYRGIQSYTPPREFGVNLRIAFGSR
jgi:iron complex outermembrane receptor protein